MSRRLHSHLQVRLIAALIGTLALTILPLPQFISAARPPWILLFTLYVQFYVPQCFRIWLVFLVGFAAFFYTSLLALMDAYNGHPCTMMMLVAAPIGCMMLWPWARVFSDAVLHP